MDAWMAGLPQVVAASQAGAAMGVVMSKGAAQSCLPWPTYRLGMLVLWGLLAGCATSSATPPLGGQLRPFGSRTTPAQPRLLLASSDGPTTGGDASEHSAQGYSVPGRNPNSLAPWEFFLGNAAHRLIAYMYGVNHPTNRVFYNTKRVIDILSELEIGDTSRLLAEERNLCPDITDATTLYIFEIKPWNARGSQEGRLEVQTYLAALNRAVAPETLFFGGADFHGAMLIRFAAGQYIWRLEWETTAPGVVQYRWTRSQQRFESAAAANDAGQWVALTEAEMRQYGGWVGQAVEGMVKRRERLAAFRDAMGLVIDVTGYGAVSFFWGAVLGRVSSTSGAQRPPTQGGGQVIPLPVRSAAPSPPARVPAAMGR